MDVREKIRQIIFEILENDENQQLIGSMSEKAKNAIVALADNLIPSQDIKYIYGSLTGANFDDSGQESQYGEVEIVWVYEGDEFVTFLDVDASFYYSEGSSGRWGSSVDDSEAPYDGEASDETISLSNDEIAVYDFDGEEHEFSEPQFVSQIKSKLENMLLGYYDPMGEVIGSKKRK